jgi:hypothetical protein
LCRQVSKVLKSAETKAARAAKSKRPKISADCATVLTTAAKTVAGGLGSTTKTPYAVAGRSTGR